MLYAHRFQGKPVSILALKQSEKANIPEKISSEEKLKFKNGPINNSFIVEAKGVFNSQDRKKHRLIKEQHPKLDIRFIFSNSKTKIGKKSQTTYAKWCELFNFKYHCVQSTKTPFPKEWLEEIKNERRN